MKKIKSNVFTELNNSELLNINGGVRGGSLLHGSISAATESAAASAKYAIGFVKGWITAWLE